MNSWDPTKYHTVQNFWLGNFNCYNKVLVCKILWQINGKVGEFVFPLFFVHYINELNITILHVM